MIINKNTRQIQTQSEHPNDNWAGDEWLIVPEHLQEKAINSYGICEIVVEGGVLVDIIPRCTAEDINALQIKNQTILDLKNELSSTDYKVIKCIECYLSGDQIPYDISILREERQTIRDKINETEETITSL